MKKDLGLIWALALVSSFVLGEIVACWQRSDVNACETSVERLRSALEVAGLVTRLEEKAALEARTRAAPKAVAQ